MRLLKALFFIFLTSSALHDYQLNDNLSNVLNDSDARSNRTKRVARSVYHIVDPSSTFETKDLLELEPLNSRNLNKYIGRLDAANEKEQDEAMEKTLRFVASYNIIPNNRDCPVCDAPMALIRDKHTSQKYIWRCAGCRREKKITKVALRDSTFFENLHLSIHEIIYLASEWIHSPKNTMEKVAELHGIDKNTVSELHERFRDLTLQWFERQHSSGQLKLGGFGKIVEIDETAMFSAKYGRGAMLLRPTVWVFGLLERGTDKILMFQVQKRDAATLLPLIAKHVLPGTTIVSDMWRAYGGIVNMQKNYRHLSVNHKINFVDPSDRTVHTQGIESSWRSMKRELKHRYGDKDFLLQGHLMNYCWRRTHQQDKLLNHLLIEMAFFKPHDTSDSASDKPGNTGNSEVNDNDDKGEQEEDSREDERHDEEKEQDGETQLPTADESEHKDENFEGPGNRMTFENNQEENEEHQRAYGSEQGERHEEENEHEENTEERKEDENEHEEGSSLQGDNEEIGHTKTSTRKSAATIRREKMGRARKIGKEFISGIEEAAAKRQQKKPNKNGFPLRGKGSRGGKVLSLMQRQQVSSHPRNTASSSESSPERTAKPTQGRIPKLPAHPRNTASSSESSPERTAKPTQGRTPKLPAHPKNTAPPSESSPESSPKPTQGRTPKLPAHPKNTAPPSESSPESSPKPTQGRTPKLPAQQKNTAPSSESSPERTAKPTQGRIPKLPAHPRNTASSSESSPERTAKPTQGRTPKLPAHPKNTAPPSESSPESSPKPTQGRTPKLPAHPKNTAPPSESSPESSPKPTQGRTPKLPAQQKNTAPSSKSSPESTPKPTRGRIPKLPAQQKNTAPSSKSSPESTPKPTRGRIPKLPAQPKNTAPASPERSAGPARSQKSPGHGHSLRPRTSKKPKF